MAEMDIAAKLESYRSELGAIVQAAAAEPAAASADHELACPEASAAAGAAESAFPEALAPRLAALVQGSKPGRK